MPRTAIAITDATVQPPVFTYSVVAVDSVNNNMFLNDGRILLLIQNPTGGSLNLTIVSTPDRFGRSDTAFTSLAITTGLTKIFGPFPQSVWNQTAADIGNVYVNAASGLMVQAIRIAATGAAL